MKKIVKIISIILILIVVVALYNGLRKKRVKDLVKNNPDIFSCGGAIINGKSETGLFKYDWRKDKSEKLSYVSFKVMDLNEEKTKIVGIVYHREFDTATRVDKYDVMIAEYDFNDKTTKNLLSFYDLYCLFTGSDKGYSDYNSQSEFFKTFSVNNIQCYKDGFLLEYDGVIYYVKSENGWKKEKIYDGCSVIRFLYDYKSNKMFFKTFSESKNVKNDRKLIQYDLSTGEEKIIYDKCDRYDFVLSDGKLFYSENDNMYSYDIASGEQKTIAESEVLLNKNQEMTDVYCKIEDVIIYGVITDGFPNRYNENYILHIEGSPKRFSVSGELKSFLCVLKK